MNRTIKIQGWHPEKQQQNNVLYFCKIKAYREPLCNELIWEINLLWRILIHYLSFNFWSWILGHGPDKNTTWITISKSYGRSSIPSIDYIKHSKYPHIHMIANGPKLLDFPFLNMFLHCILRTNSNINLK